MFVHLEVWWSTGASASKIRLLYNIYGYVIITWRFQIVDKDQSIITVDIICNVSRVQILLLYICYVNLMLRFVHDTLGSYASIQSISACLSICWFNVTASSIGIINLLVSRWTHNSRKTLVTRNLHPVSGISAAFTLRRLRPFQSSKITLKKGCPGYDARLHLVVVPHFFFFFFYPRRRRV